MIENGFFKKRKRWDKGSATKNNAHNGSVQSSNIIIKLFKIEWTLNVMKFTINFGYVK